MYTAEGREADRMAEAIVEVFEHHAVINELIGGCKPATESVLPFTVNLLGRRKQEAGLQCVTASDAVGSIAVFTEVGYSRRSTGLLTINREGMGWQ
jgi:hypothetical protein